MSLLRTSPLDLSWPSWMRSRIPTWADMYEGLEHETAIRVEEYQEDGQYVIRAEIPGIDPDEDVEIVVEDSMLRLSVHKQREKHIEDKRHWRSEFSYGSFQRSILLPAASSQDNVKATYEDGVLEIRIPLDGKATKSRKINVTRRNK
ncbi:MAG: hypothetical protein RLZZ254_5 [Actinomycetota bacterium]